MSALPRRSHFPFHITKSAYLIFSMASLLSLSLLSFFLFLSLSSASRRHPKAPTASPSAPSSALVQNACKATRFPQQCQASLTNLPPEPTSVQIVQSAMAVSSDNLKKAQSMVKSILDSSASSINRTTACNICIEVLRGSDYRIGLANDALPRGRNKDARAWMSAALLYQYDCWSALKYANDTRQVGEAMAFLDSLIGLSSNALSMMASYDVFGKDTASWRPPLTERDGFWEGSGSDAGPLGFRGGFPNKVKPDATVCKDGKNGCYKTVQEAVNAAPENAGAKKFVIYIKQGVYEEAVTVPLEKKNVVFYGDGIGKTVITGSAYAAQPGKTTYLSATVSKFQF